MEESERTRRRTRVLTRARKPLSDRTNTSHSSSLPLNPTKPNPPSFSSAKASAKRASATNAPTNLDNASPNPSAPPPPLVSAPSSPKTSSRRGIVNSEASVPISVALSRIVSSIVRNDKGKSVAFPVSSTPIPKISDSRWQRQQSDGVEGSKLKRTSATNAPTILDNTSANPSSPPRFLVSGPSPLTTSPDRGTVGIEASDVVFSRGTSSSKRKDKGKSVVFPVSSTTIPKISDSGKQSDGVEGSITTHAPATNTPTILDNTSPNPTSPPPFLVSAPSSPTTSSPRGSEPISVVYSRRTSLCKRKDKRNSLRKRKDKRKSVAFPLSSTPIQKISDSRQPQQSDGVEGSNLPKAKAMTVPCRKKQRAVSSEKDIFKDPSLQDYIEKKKAYFKMIDEFELSEEEVENVEELD